MRELAAGQMRVADWQWRGGIGLPNTPIRCKRLGQFWTSSGQRHLDALEEARDNGHWDELWLNA